MQSSIEGRLYGLLKRSVYYIRPPRAGHDRLFARVGYVENSLEGRTKLGAVFSSLVGQ